MLGAGRWHQMRQARAAQRDADGLREHHAHRRDRDPHRDHAELPRPRRPDPGLLGLDARRRVRGRRDHHRARGGTSCRPASAWSWSCWPSPWSGRPSRRSSTRGCGAADVTAELLEIRDLHGRPTGPSEGPLPAVRGVDLVVARRRGGRRRRGVRLRQVDAGQHRPAAAAARTRTVDGRGAGRGRGRADDALGRPARRCAGPARRSSSRARCTRSTRCTGSGDQIAEPIRLHEPELSRRRRSRARVGELLEQVGLAAGARPRPTRTSSPAARSSG